MHLAGTRRKLGLNRKSHPLHLLHPSLSSTLHVQLLLPPKAPIPSQPQHTRQQIKIFWLQPWRWSHRYFHHHLQRQPSHLFRSKEQLKGWCQQLLRLFSLSPGRRSLPKELHEWIGRPLFRNQCGRAVLTDDLQIWWYPPQPCLLYHQPPASPDVFVTCLLFVDALQDVVLQADLQLSKLQMV